MKPLSYITLRTLIFDYVLNRFLDTAGESLTTYLDLDKIQPGMEFEEIIHVTGYVTATYNQCRILKIGKSIINDEVSIIDFSYKDQSSGLGLWWGKYSTTVVNGLYNTQASFDRITKLVPGKTVTIQMGERFNLADMMRRFSITMSTTVKNPKNIIVLD